LSWLCSSPGPWLCPGPSPRIVVSSSIPMVNASSCEIIFFQFRSLFSSGSTSVVAMYSRLPAARLIAYGMSVSVCVRKKYPSIPPSIANIALRKLNSSAFFLLSPAFTSSAKSPISCGISCATIAAVIAIPVAGFMMKLAAMSTPSRKLCSPSAMSTSHANGFFSFGWCLQSSLWWCQCSADSSRKKIIIPMSTHVNECSISNAASIAPAAKLMSTPMVLSDSFTLFDSVSTPMNDTRLTSVVAMSMCMSVACILCLVPMVI
jgi:hypothetical protein